VIAFDTSALVKLVIVEPESGALRAWLDARAAQAWVASDLCRVEVVRAVRRVAPQAVDTARELLMALDLVPLSRPLLDSAAALRPPSLRSLDAIHLASASTLGAELTAFVVYDDRLATELQLPVARPS
jgi:uncharacterized protein